LNKNSSNQKSIKHNFEIWIPFKYTLMIAIQTNNTFDHFLNGFKQILFTHGLSASANCEHSSLSNNYLQKEVSWTDLCADTAQLGTRGVRTQPASSQCFWRLVNTYDFSCSMYIDLLSNLTFMYTKSTLQATPNECLYN
jgi:hypothetical protein